MFIWIRINTKPRTFRRHKTTLKQYSEIQIPFCIQTFSILLLRYRGVISGSRYPRPFIFYPEDSQHLTVLDSVRGCISSLSLHLCVPGRMGDGPWKFGSSCAPFPFQGFMGIRFGCEGEGVRGSGTSTCSFKAFSFKAKSMSDV